MYKKIVFLFIIGIALSCNKSDDSQIDPAAGVTGEWQVTTVKTTLQNQGTVAQVTDIDLSTEAVFFNFKTDGTYTTNAKINLSSISKSDKIFEGTYKFEKENLELDYFLEDFGLSVKFDFKINELQSNKMTMALDEGSLLDAFNASIGQLSAANQVFAKLLINNIVDFEALINLKK
jgi:hypothetical protein